MKQVGVVQGCGKWDDTVYESLQSFSIDELETPVYITDKEYSEILETFGYHQERDTYSSHPDVLKMREKLAKVATHYMRNEEDVTLKLESLLDTRQENINKLGKLTHSFRFVKKSTTTLSLISACLELMYGVGTTLSRIFLKEGLEAKLPLIALGIVGGVSVSGSIIALTYSKHASEGMFRDLKKEKIVLRELEVILRKGNWMDKELEELFPYHIDLELIENFGSTKFAVGRSWKENVYVAIILSNMRKDKDLIKDEKFLTIVNILVDSPATRMWFYRMKIRKFLIDMTKSLDCLLQKKNVAGNEVFLNHAALNLYPVFFPLFYESGKMERVRIFCSAAAIFSALWTLGNSDDVEFKEMKSNYLSLLKEYKRAKKMSGDLIDEYN